MILLVDVGNTAIKFAFFNNKKITVFLFINSSEIISEKNLILLIQKSLKEYNYDLSYFILLCLSSVRPMWDTIFKQISNDLNFSFYQLKDNLFFDDLLINVPNKNNIGSDIIACAYGAIKEYNNDNGNFIIINMGTASVISLILANNFSGAIIMPGLITASNGLFSSAQMLQHFEVKWEEKIIGTNTKEAINIGVVKSHYYAIKAFLFELEQKYDSPTIIFTGNNSKYFSNKFSEAIFDDNLLFKGLILFLVTNGIIKKELVK